MQQNKFWGRVGHWFRGAGRSASDDGLSAVSSDALFGGDGGPGQDRGGGVAPLSKRRRREQALERLQDGYVQVAGVVDAIHKHLEAQGQRTERIADSINRLAETTARLPEAAQAQTEKLADIASQLEVGNDRSRRWEQMLVDLPKIADAQREALVTIGRELETSQQTDRSMLQSSEQLRAAVNTWSKSAVASTETLRRIQETACQRDDRLASLMVQQSKRFTWFFVMTAILAGAAILTGILALVRLTPPVNG